METAEQRLKSLTVADVMSHQVVWVSIRQRMADVASILLRHEISSAPVVDELGACVGMISASDFLRRDSESDDLSNAPHRHRPAWSPDDVVGTFMSNAVQTIDGTATLLQAARVMCAQHVHRLPVVTHDGKPIGVISTMDIVAALTNAMAEEEAAQ